MRTLSGSSKLARAARHARDNRATSMTSELNEDENVLKNQMKELENQIHHL